MEYRQFGQTDLRVSVIGSAGEISGTYGQIDETHFIRASIARSTAASIVSTQPKRTAWVHLGARMARRLVRGGTTSRSSPRAASAIRTPRTMR
jgi:hypothetical protein